MRSKSERCKSETCRLADDGEGKKELPHFEEKRKSISCNDGERSSQSDDGSGGIVTLPAEVR